MPPLTQDPDALRAILAPAQRRALYDLTRTIASSLRAQLDLPPPAANIPQISRLRIAAIAHFDTWRAQTLSKLKDILAKPDDQTVLEARRKRAEAQPVETAKYRSEDLLVFVDDASPPADTADEEEALRAFQRLYTPIPSRLATIPVQDRKEIISAMILLLLSTGSYSAHSRVLVCHLVSALEVPPSFLDTEEKAIAVTMMDTARKADEMSAEAEAQKRRDEGRTGRMWKVGLASVAGAAIVGVTGGLAAPVVAAAVGGLMGSVGLGGLAGFLGLFWMNGALVGTLFGAFGAKMTGEMVDSYAKEVEDFKFLPLGAEWGRQWTRTDGEQGSARRLRVTIGINGWLESEDDVTKPWRVIGDESEVFALRYEMSSLMSLGEQLRALVGSAAWNIVRAEILKRTVLITLQTALWPIFLLNSASSIDNPFSLAKNRSEKAGRVLADALINKVQGERPVTLIGYSLGARVIYSCLRVLAERQAFGLVDTVVLIGAPVPSNASHWQLMRSVVAGKMFNVHSKNDFILGFLYRSTSLQLGIAGLQGIGKRVEGVEDIDLSEEVHGHLRYPGLIAQILHRCGFKNVQNGAATIEKEKLSLDSEIQLHDKDYGESGNLIDFGEEKSESPLPLLPPRHTVSEMENLKFDCSVKDMLDQKSIAPTFDTSVTATTENFNPSPSIIDKTIKTSSATTDLLETSARPEVTVLPGRNASESIADQPQVGHQPANNNDDEEEDVEEEYFEAPIAMVDYDDSPDGLAMLEPLSIDDDEFESEKHPGHPR